MNLAYVVRALDVALIESLSQEKGVIYGATAKLTPNLNQGLINKLFMTQLQKIALKCFVKLIVCINYHHISLVQVRMHCIWLVSLR